MDSNQLADFLADPVSFLGDWIVESSAGGGTPGVDRPSVNLGSNLGSFEYISYPAASNYQNLYVHKDTPERRYVCGSDNPGKQSQRLPSYYLPWSSNKSYYMTLGDHADFFLTARLNGCCIMIGGPSDAPTVVHANCSPEALNEVDVSGLPIQQMGIVLREKQRAIYDKYYWALMGKLIAVGVLSDQHPVKLFDPGTYFKHDGNLARVYGIRREGNWSFYGCMETSSRIDGKITCVNEQIA